MHPGSKCSKTVDLSDSLSANFNETFGNKRHRIEWYLLIRLQRRLFRKIYSIESGFTGKSHDSFTSFLFKNTTTLVVTECLNLAVLIYCS